MLPRLAWWVSAEAQSFALVLWVLAIGIFSLKALWPWFDELTQYGKLRRPGDSSAFSLFGVSQGMGMTIFYAAAIALMVTKGFLQGHAASLETSVHSQSRSNSAFLSTVPFQLGLLQLVFLVHVTRRLIECLFVHQFSRRAMSDINVVAGLYYYVSLVFSIPVATPYAWLLETRDTFTHHWIWIASIAGVLVWAEWRQADIHLQLARLRPNPIPASVLDANRRHQSSASASAGVSDDASAAVTYGVPSRRAFHDALCPHYFAEIVFYAALAVLANTLPMYLHLLFVVLNLLTNASSTMKWYTANFAAAAQNKQLPRFLLLAPIL